MSLLKPHGDSRTLSRLPDAGYLFFLVLYNPGSYAIVLLLPSSLINGHPVPRSLYSLTGLEVETLGWI